MKLIATIALMFIAALAALVAAPVPVDLVETPATVTLSKQLDAAQLSTLLSAVEMPEGVEIAAGNRISVMISGMAGEGGRLRGKIVLSTPTPTPTPEPTPEE